MFCKLKNELDKVTAKAVKSVKSRLLQIYGQMFKNQFSFIMYIVK